MLRKRIDSSLSPTLLSYFGYACQAFVPGMSITICLSRCVTPSARSYSPNHKPGLSNPLKPSPAFLSPAPVPRYQGHYKDPPHSPGRRSVLKSNGCPHLRVFFSFFMDVLCAFGSFTLIKGSDYSLMVFTRRSAINLMNCVCTLSCLCSKE